MDNSGLSNYENAMYNVVVSRFYWTLLYLPDCVCTSVSKTNKYGLGLTIELIEEGETFFQRSDRALPRLRQVPFCPRMYHPLWLPYLLYESIFTIRYGYGTRNHAWIFYRKRKEVHSYCLYLLVPAINIPRLVFQFSLCHLALEREKNGRSNQCSVNYGQIIGYTKIHIFFCQWIVIKLSSVFFSHECFSNCL